MEEALAQMIYCSWNFDPLVTHSRLVINPINLLQETHIVDAVAADFVVCLQPLVKHPIYHPVNEPFLHQI